MVRHADAGRLKGVHLCLWAGADPHARIFEGNSRTANEIKGDSQDEGTTAVEAAAISGHAAILLLLRPDPARDRWDVLYQRAQNGPTAAVLAAIAPPRDVGPVLLHQTFWLDDYWHAFDWEPVGVVEEVFKAGGRWIASSPDEIAIIRRNLLKANPTNLLTVMRCLAKGNHCNPAVLQELARTPGIRQRLTAIGLLPSPQADRAPWGRSPNPRPRAGKLASKVGITAQR